MTGWFDLGATQQFWTRDTWIGRSPDLKIYRKHCTKKLKFLFKDFSSYSSFLRICSHLLKKSLMENAIFCAMVENTCNFVIIIVNTAQKVSVFEVVLFCIFPYSDWIWSAFSQFELNSNWPYSVRMRENADHNNSEYGHFSHSAILK